MNLPESEPHSSEPGSEERYPYFARHSQGEYEKLLREGKGWKVAFLISFSIAIIVSVGLGITSFIYTGSIADALFFTIISMGLGCFALVKPFFEGALSNQRRLNETNEKIRKDDQHQRQLEYQKRIANSADLQLGALIDMTKKLDGDSKKGSTQNFTFSGSATNVSISANNVGGDFIQQSEVGTQDNAALAAALSDIAAALHAENNEEASKTFERLKKRNRWAKRPSNNQSIVEAFVGRSAQLDKTDIGRRDPNQALYRIRHRQPIASIAK